VPQFFGPIHVDRVIEGENDISDQYLLESAYLVRFIDKRFTKVNLDSEAKSEICKFKEIDVNYTIDADFCRTENGYLFIDFAVIGVREEIEGPEYYGKNDHEKFKLFFERNPFLSPENFRSLMHK
jgi:hypothetical protein